MNFTEHGRDGWEPRKMQIFRCPACDEYHCYCEGCWDEAPALCDACWERLVGDCVARAES